MGCSSAFLRELCLRVFIGSKTKYILSILFVGDGLQLFADPCDLKIVYNANNLTGKVDHLNINGFLFLLSSKTRQAQNMRVAFISARFAFLQVKMKPLYLAFDEVVGCGLHLILHNRRVCLCVNELHFQVTSHVIKVLRCKSLIISTQKKVHLILQSAFLDLIITPFLLLPYM